MKTASIGEVKSQFSAFIKACESNPIIVTRNGKPVAVLVGVEDEDEIERVLMANSPRQGLGRTDRHAPTGAEGAYG